MRETWCPWSTSVGPLQTSPGRMSVLGIVPAGYLLCQLCPLGEVLSISTLTILVPGGGTASGLLVLPTQMPHMRPEQLGPGKRVTLGSPG